MKDLFRVSLNSCIFSFLQGGQEYIPDLVTKEAVRKLIKLVQQRDAINSLPDEERVEFLAVTIPLDALAQEICELVCIKPDTGTPSNLDP